MSTPAPEVDDIGKTHASPSAPIPPQSGTLGESRHSTVLPAIEWQGDQPRLVTNNRSRFEELKELGRGGMGEVVLAKDHDIDRTVALKKLPPGSDLGSVLRFVEEVRAVGKLEHPNIVPVHDVGLDADGRFFFVMKHLHGETLDAVIKKLRAGDPEARARFSRPVRMQIFLGVLHAVSYAHRQGFVHRDLKPANIMIGPYGEVTVVDWGLAKQLRTPGGAAPRARAGELPAVDSPAATGRDELLRTRQGALIGTPLYMSPEQARGEHDKVDERSDVFALSVIAHELSTLAHYLEGRETLPEVLDGVQTVLPAHPSLAPKAGAERAPAELAWFFEKGMAKDPAQRYQSVDEMIDQLQLLLDGRFRAQCARTRIKRTLYAGIHNVDQHPWVPMVLGPVLALLSVVGLVKLVFDLVR